MHLKSYALDARLLRTGSANWSPTGLKCQDNDVRYEASTEAVDLFEQKFEEMWQKLTKLERVCVRSVGQKYGRASLTGTRARPAKLSTGIKQVPSYWVFNAMASKPITERIELQANVYNLANNLISTNRTRVI